MNEQYKPLIAKYGAMHVGTALVYAQHAAIKYPESYTTPGFVPHVWVVAAICEALDDAD